MIIDYYIKLYPYLPDITLYRDDSRWIKAAKFLGAKHFKLLTVRDVENDNSYIANFVRYQQNVIIYPLLIGTNVLGFGFRSIQGKEFSLLPATHVSLYSSTSAIRLFEKKEPIQSNPLIVLSEGVLDAEFFGLITPLSFAYLKGKMDSFQMQMISLLTNRIVICPDRDKTGDKSRQKTIYGFQKFGIVPKFVDLPSQYGDPGEILISLMENKKQAYITKSALTQEINLFNQKQERQERINYVKK
jgi:hypothetical protein